MNSKDLINVYLLFSGLFATYSLNRLHSMRLYNLDFIFAKSPFCRVAYRWLAGAFANIVVATLFVGSYYWFIFLLDQMCLNSFIGRVVAVSMVISSSSMILASHRIIAGVVLIFKHKLFIWDRNVMKSATAEFKMFLKTKPMPHCLGALFFLLLQMAFGYFIHLVDI